MSRVTVWALLLGALGAAIRTQPAWSQEKPDKKAEMTRALTAIHDHYRKWQAADAAGKKADATRHYEQFRDGFRKIAADLPEVKPERGAVKGYTRLEMNGGAPGVAGFRFKTPPGKGTWNLDWEFVVPADALESWYILPVKGTMTGFKTFRTVKDHKEKGADLPARNLRVVQPLHQGALKSGSEYIIWFRFNSKGPVPLHIRMALTEAEKSA